MAETLEKIRNGDLIEKGSAFDEDNEDSASGGDYAI
jgi:hypothetical protein